MVALAVAVAALLLVSCFASGSEAALFAIPYARVLTFVEEGRAGSASLKRIKDDMRRPIMAIVVLNNLANVVGSMVVGAMAANLFSSRMLGVFSALLTIAVIVYAEVLPKTVGERHADRIAPLVAPLVVVLSWLLLPLLFLIGVLVRPFAGAPSVRMTSEEEIRALTQLGGEHGVIEEDEGRLIQRVFRLNDTTARDIMTPIARVDVLDGDKTLGELHDELASATHSRLPVYVGAIDHIQGVVHLRHLLQAVGDGKMNVKPTELCTEATFVPDTMSGDALLEHFRVTRNHLAAVVDERGTVLGVVSLEDVLEELVGEIEDEKDEVLADLTVVGPDELVCQPAVTTGRINEILGTRLPDGTLGELLLAATEEIPNAGDYIALDELDVWVLAASARAVERVRIKRSTRTPV